MKFMEYAKIQGSYYIAFVLALHTGMRIGEVLALQWKDINFESKDHSCTKNVNACGW